MVYVLTEAGKRAVRNYLTECEMKRKEILESGKDTAYETELPTEEDILCDVTWQGLDSEGEYDNSFGLTDNFDLPISLKLGVELAESAA